MTATRLRAISMAHMRLPAGDLVMGAEGHRRVPFPAFLVEHPGGLVVYDTGLSAQAYDDPAAYFGERIALVRPEFSAEQRIDRRLRALGYEPSMVTDVVLSHAHSDHTGGLIHFPGARFHVGAGELDWARAAAEAGDPHVRWQEHLEPALAFDWHPLSGSRHDILGDGSIIAVRTAGHTPGHLSLLVRLPSGSVLLTGDATHLREGLDGDLVDPIDVDADAARRSLQTLRDLERDGIRLWIAHDPDDGERYGALPYLE